MLLQSLRDDHHYEVVRSVLEYGAHAPGWRFVGAGTTPFVRIDKLGEVKADGVIGAIYGETEAALLTASGIPAVTVVGEQPDLGLPRVDHDDAVIGRMGAEHLLERGAVALGFVGEVDSSKSARRRDAFGEGVKNAGRSCRVLEEIWDDGTVPRDRIGAWLRTMPKPIGIMACIDHYARLTIEAALQTDLRVPDDVIVLGVNNNPWTIAMSPVPLSSIELDMRRIGLTAANMLDDLMNGETPPSQFVPPRGVVVRRSTEIILTEDPLVTRALKYIRDHIAVGVNVEEVLFELGVSRSTLVNRMKHTIGQTPHEAICRARIDQSKLLLVNTEESMAQIARRCGFDCQPRFNETFKRHTGMTPSQFRQQRSR